MGDLGVVKEEVPFGEEDFPVAVTGADERERAGAGVGHVGADVEKVFEEPECAEGGAGGFAAEEKISGAGERDDEFEQSPAEDHERVAEVGFRATAENAEKRMAGFVDGKICEIEEQETGAVVRSVEKEEEIEGDGNDGDGAGDGFPIVEGGGGPLHGKRVARASSRAAGIGGRCFPKVAGGLLRYASYVFDVAVVVTLRGAAVVLESNGLARWRWQ